MTVMPRSLPRSRRRRIQTEAGQFVERGKWFIEKEADEAA